MHVHTDSVACDVRWRNAVSVCAKCHTKFVEGCLVLADAFHSLDSGEMSRKAIGSLHNDCKKDKKNLKQIFDKYWSEPDGLEAPP